MAGSVTRMTKCVIVALALVALSGCRRDLISIDAAILPEDVLSESARTEFDLPSKTDLTLAKRADVDLAKDLAPETIKAVEEFLEPTGRRIQIAAARPIGKYLLLWVGFPEVADGGVDLIFSVEKKRVVGTFCGG
jgi:hypothetical protein